MEIASFFSESLVVSILQTILESLKSSADNLWELLCFIKHLQLAYNRQCR